MGKELTPSQIASCANVICLMGVNKRYSEFNSSSNFTKDGEETARSAAEFVRIPGVSELEDTLRDIALLFGKAKGKIVDDPLAKKVISNGNSVGIERVVPLKKGKLTLIFTVDGRFHIRFLRHEPQSNSKGVFRETTATIRKNGDFLLSRNLITSDKKRVIAKQSWELERRAIKQRRLGSAFTFVVRDIKHFFTSYLNQP